MALDYDNPPPLNYNTGTLAASIVVPGRICVYSFTFYSSNVGAQKILMFDANTVPGAGAVPLMAYSIGAGSGLSVTFENGRQFQTGLVLATSSTAATFTAGSADTFFDVQFDVFEEQNAPGTGA